MNGSVKNDVRLNARIDTTEMKIKWDDLVCWGGGTSCSGRTVPAHSALIGWRWLPTAPLRRHSQSVLNVGSSQGTNAPRSVLCCCAESPSTSCPLLERGGETERNKDEDRNQLECWWDLVGRYWKWDACVCRCLSMRATCHVTVDELRLDWSTAVHVYVIMSWCVASVFVRLTWLLIHRCERQWKKLTVLKVCQWAALTYIWNRNVGWK